MRVNDKIHSGPFLINRHMNELFTGRPHRFSSRCRLLHPRSIVNMDSDDILRNERIIGTPARRDHHLRI